jgi:hypothetical protein
VPVVPHRIREIVRRQRPTLGEECGACGSCCWYEADHGCGRRGDRPGRRRVVWDVPLLVDRGVVDHGEEQLDGDEHRDGRPSGECLPDRVCAADRDGDSDGDSDGDPGLGPYARPAAELLTAHAPGVRGALTRYDHLVSGALADPPGLVLTHGEPHAGNTMRTDAGWLLIDWDTVLAAPPERDLWDLDPGDGTLRAYAAATGTALRPDLLELCRLRWDLTEIALGVARFREPHGASADDEESWTILKDLVTGTAG